MFVVEIGEAKPFQDLAEHLVYPAWRVAFAE
jgi:hypothetical protein